MGAIGVNDAQKLVSTADWLTNRFSSKDEMNWFEPLSPSHLYELSRMSSNGYGVVQKEVSCPDFTFNAGQQSISVRRLEQIRRSYLKNEVMSNEESISPQSVQVPSVEAQEVHRGRH